jgi:titin
VDGTTATVSVANIPAAPTNLQATTVSCNRIDLSWSDNSADETGFRIERKKGTSGTWSETAWVVANTQSYRDTGVSSSTAYYYRVWAYNEVGISAYSNEASATTSVPISITSQPASQTISSGQTATLSVAATGTAPLSYQWYRGNKGDTANPVGGATLNSYTTSILTATTTYWVRVTNLCGSVDSNAATITVVVAPAAPSNLVAAAVSSTRIDLTWKDNSNDETGFKIERKTELGGAWAETKTVSTNVQSYQDTGLTAGTTYYYRVRAYNAAGNSAYSNEAYATTCVPLSITSQPQSQAIQSAQQATLSVTVTGSAPLTYQWYRGKSGDTSNPISGATLSTYTTPALTATTTYWVRVSNPCGSVNSAGATVTVGEDVTITKRHVGKFVVGMKGLYQLTVKNVGATATSGTITVTDTLVTGLNYISATGEGWTCSAQGKTVTCTLSTSLAVGTSSEITLTVEVMAAAAPGVTNAATVAMSGDGNPDNNRAEDTAIVRSSEWTTYGPVGGTINGLALDPQKPDTIYASEDGSGVHKSTNAGSSWNLVLSGWWWGPLAIDPRDPATIYASRWPTTIYKSTDGGATWINASSGLGGTGRALTVDPGDPSTIYAGTDSGVFKTTSKAAAWSAVNSGLSDTDTYSLAIDSISPSVVYAGTYHRVYKSGNGGASWTVMSTGLPDSVVYALAIDPGDSTVVYAGTSKGVYKSGDAGVRWSAVNSGLSNLIVHAVVIDPLSRSTVYVGTEGGVYQTLTGGTSWTLVGSGLSNQKIYSLALDAERPSTLHAGTHGSGVYSITLIPASCAPPSITTHPQSQTIQSGQTATLSVTVAGTAPLFYQWYWGDKGDTSDSISGATSSTYTTPALTATTRYRVRVSNDCGSVESNAATITVGGPAVPSPPTNVVATAVSSSQIDLAWQDNSNDETGFKIERKTGASGTWAEIGTVGINVQSYQDKALAAGTTYYYRARAYNLAGNSPYSNEASATTSVACVPPSVTTQPQSQTIQSGQTATLSVTAAGTAPLSYQWYRGNKGDTSNPISGATSNSYTTPALTATTSNWVRVSNDCGSVDSNAATVTVPQVPPPPTNLAATAVSSTRIDLSWNDNSSDETGFRIERKTGSLGAWAEIATVAPDVRSYQDTGLTAGTTYYYRVRAYNAAGNSAYSNEASATTSAACVPPSITTQPQSQTIQSGQTATLSVTAAGTAPLSYQWYRGNKGDTSNPISGATSNSYTTPALTATTSYWVRVSDSCSSVDSATAIVTVQTAPDLKITKSHSGNFTVGSSGAYMLAVTNVGTGATTGTITVIDTLPGGLSYVSATGVDWSCSASGQNVTCTRTNSLMTGATTIITLTAGVSSAAMPAVSNTASVATNGDTNSGNNTSADATTIVLPALPAVTVSGLGAVVTPGSQQSITVSLASAFPVAISGRLQLTFTPDTGISVDDPAILFATGGRTVDFTIAANSTQALFSNNLTSVGVRTGTVAGTIDIRSTLRYLTTDLTPSPAPVCSGKVDKSPPVITDISASRTGSAGFRVVIVGYSTSRQMTEATFRFNCASDVDLTTPSIRVDLGQAFSAWYQGSESAQYGSMFSLTVDFTVSAHANAIIAVSATLTNAQGTSNEKSASF